MNIGINARFLAHAVTGIQRHAIEVSQRLDHADLITPGARLVGWRGHLWEQTLLPARLGSRLLWNPCQSGPLAPGIRHVTTIHDLSPIDHPEWFGRAYRSWYSKAIVRLARSAQRTLSVSEFTRDRLVEVTGVDAANIVIVGNGVDPAFFTTTAKPRQPYVLVLGSIEPRKGLDVLVRSWQQIPESTKDGWILKVAGNVGSARVFRAADVNWPSSVELLGYVPDQDLPSLYAQAAIFVYPSLYEGFGIPPIEAMASGTPTVVSDHPALRETTMGRACYFRNHDARDLARILTELMRDPSLRDEIGRKGPAVARQHTWERTAAITERVLTEAR